MFYSPKGAAKAEPKVVQLFLLIFYFWVRKRILDFQFSNGDSPFWNLENVLSPEGTAIAEPKVVQLFFTYVLLRSREGFLDVSFQEL